MTGRLTVKRRGDDLERSAEPIGLMHTWWRGDPLPVLPPLPHLTMAPTDDRDLLHDLTGLDEGELRERLERGHRPWLARIGDEPVAYGWVATQEAAIDQFGLTLLFLPGDRYLWDFVTLPAWRGRGIYPRLLQSIVLHDGEGEQLWVGHDLDNVASLRGIARAGFVAVGTLYRLPDRGYEFVSSGPIERAAAAAVLLEVPLAG